MAMTDDETMEPTLGDIYVLGDDENKAEIEDMLEKIVEHQCEYGLKDDLRQVLTGCGYTVHRQDRGPEVLIDNYRPGKNVRVVDAEMAPRRSHVEGRLSHADHVGRRRQLGRVRA